jgi:hypothetical protein
MDLNKLQTSWDGFPELSMEERPLLSSDLGKMTTHNPFAGPFDVKSKLQGRIVTGAVLWGLAIYRLDVSWRVDGADLYLQGLILVLLTYFIYFHVRLLLYAGYPTLASLRLIPFLTRIEHVMESYMHSFRMISILASLYMLAVLEKIFALSNGGASGMLENGMNKWLILAGLSTGFYMFFLHTSIGKYKRLMMAVRSYREGIILAKPQKE